MSALAAMGSVVLQRRDPDGPDDYTGRGTIAGYPYLFRAWREVSEARDVIRLSIYTEPARSAQPGQQKALPL